MQFESVFADGGQQIPGFRRRPSSGTYWFLESRSVGRFRVRRTPYRAYSQPSKTRVGLWATKRRRIPIDHGVRIDPPRVHKTHGQGLLIIAKTRDRAKEPPA